MRVGNAGSLLCRGPGSGVGYLCLHLIGTLDCCARALEVIPSCIGGYIVAHSAGLPRCTLGWMNVPAASLLK
jgi:hypothetical protein